MKNYGDIDSKFRFVILASMRAKQLLRGAKPLVKSKSKNLIRIAQEEVRQGLVDYEIVKSLTEEFPIEEPMFIGEGIEAGVETDVETEEEEVKEKQTKAKKTEKKKESKEKKEDSKKKSKKSTKK